MHIKSTISDITSQLISLYATMDHWCDRFTVWSEVGDLDPQFASTFTTINSVNEFILRLLKDLTAGKQITIVYPANQPTDLAALSDASFAELLRTNDIHVNAMFDNNTCSQVRDHLREQLYRYLVLLEQMELIESERPLNEITKLISVIAGIAARINTTIRQTRLTY